MKEYKSTKELEELLQGVRDKSLTTKERSLSYFTRKRCPLKTGFSCLDKHIGGGLNGGLFVLGAESSIGKSAFSFALAMSLLERSNVLYFASEMDEMEFVARGTSMVGYEKFKKDSKHPVVPYVEIKDYRYDKFRKDSIIVDPIEYEEDHNDYCERTKGKLMIISSQDQKFTIADICNLIHTAKEDENFKDKPLVVFIDYLQQIAGRGDKTMDMRKSLSDAIDNLKVASLKYRVPVFAISSVSRANYGKGVSMGALKESGDIEFSANVVMGWDWDGVTNTDNTDAAGNQKKIDADRKYRKMKMTFLKNRDGLTGGNVFFKYYPAYNYFEEWKEEYDPSLPFDEEVIDKPKRVIVNKY